MIKLSDGTTLLLREVEKYLVLISIIKSDDNFDRLFLVDYNIDIFTQGLKKLFELKC